MLDFDPRFSATAMLVAVCDMFVGEKLAEALLCRHRVNQHGQAQKCYGMVFDLQALFGVSCNEEAQTSQTCYARFAVTIKPSQCSSSKLCNLTLSPG